MTIVSDRAECLDLLGEMVERRVPLVAVNFDDKAGLVAILQATRDLAERFGFPRMGIMVSATGNYPSISHVRCYSQCDDDVVGFRMWRSDLEHLAGVGGPFEALRVVPNLDHAQPGAHDALIEQGADWLGSIMYDTETMAWEEKLSMTARFVERFGARVVCEGPVDEPFLDEAGHEKHDLTTPDRAGEFLRATGVDLIVCNLGTEHQSPTETASYSSDVARAITERVGPIQVLHGSSSMAVADLGKLADDGVYRINIYTRVTSRAVQHEIATRLRNAHRIFGPEALQGLIDEGLLAPRPVEGAGPVKPEYQGSYAGALYRDKSRELVRDILLACRYDRWGDK